MFSRGVFAGFVLCLVMMAAVGILASAMSCEREYVGLNTISRHIDPGRKYNEEHWGPFYECRRNQDWSYQLGYYNNSFERDTWYVMVMYQPWTVLGTRIGGFAGAGTGYKEKKIGGETVPVGGLSPLVGMMFSLDNLNLIVAPAVVALQLKVEF